jgi:hypothetical protein
MLPNDISSAKFLLKEERDLAIERLTGVEHGTGNKERYDID